MTLRCFVAIELDEGIGRQLGRLQGRLGKELSLAQKAIRWVKPEQIHLTLKFLGEVDDKTVPDICKAVSSAGGEFDPFEFEVGNCGCFGSGGVARVLWVGVTSRDDKLGALAESVDKHLQKMGFAPEHRKFSAHLTLARIRDAAAGAAAPTAARCSR